MENKEEKREEKTEGYSKKAYIIAGVLGLIGLTVAIVIYQLFIPASWHHVNKEIIIPAGTTPSGVAEIMYENGLIRNKEVFLSYIILTGTDRKIQAGLYEFSPTYSLHRIAKMLKENRGIKLIKITIPEGFSIKKISALLQHHGLVRQKDFVSYMEGPVKEEMAEEFEFLAEIPVNSIEGYLYPETYLFAKGVSKEKIVRALIRQFEVNILEIWEKRPPYHPFSLHETLTLASMIEKEARVKEEMKRISSVFHNRLQKGMQLASDPTVLYALGEPDKRRVLYKDLEVDSPYNTYRYKGLPPGPIASPGIKAFYAAIYPEKTPYMFFVANHDGTHTFTETYEEHLRVQIERR